MCHALAVLLSFQLTAFFLHTEDGGIDIRRLKEDLSSLKHKIRFKDMKKAMKKGKDQVALDPGKSVCLFQSARQSVYLYTYVGKGEINGFQH